MKTTTNTTSKVVESSFLQAFAGTQPGTTRPAQESTPGGLDIQAYRRARAAVLTAPGKGQWDY